MTPAVPPAEQHHSLLTPDGVALAYRLTRRGTPRPAVVLLHGMASNMTRWSEFVANTRLGEDWDVLRLDLRGHAESISHGRIGMDVWCADLAAILDAEAIPDAILVGHCMGANLALHFADRHPARVRALVLIEPMYREALTGTLARSARFRPLISLAVPALRLMARLGLYRRKLPPIDLAKLDQEAREHMAAEKAGFPSQRYASPLEDLRHFPLVAYVQDMLAVTGPLPPPESIRAPVLVLLSQGSGFASPTLTARLLESLPAGRIEQLDAEHWIPTEQPDVMRTLIEQWCDQHRRQDSDQQI